MKEEEAPGQETEGKLEPDKRRKMAAHARRAHYAGLVLKSAKARRIRKAAETSSTPLPSSELPPNPRALWKLLRKTKGNPGPIPRIAEALGVSEPTVKRSLATLVAAGMVGIEDHGCHPNTYKLSTWRQISITFDSVNSGRLLDQNDPTISRRQENSAIPLPPAAPGARGGPLGEAAPRATGLPALLAGGDSPTAHPTNPAARASRATGLPGLPGVPPELTDYLRLFLDLVEKRDGPVASYRLKGWVRDIRRLVILHPGQELWEMTEWLFLVQDGVLPFVPEIAGHFRPNKRKITHPDRILWNWDNLVAYRRLEGSLE